MFGNIFALKRQKEEDAELSDKKRLEYVDIAKGLGMLAVVWGHIHTAGPTCSFVYAFDIPMFFFLSGMMFNSKKYDSLKKLLKNRVRTLLLPYVCFSVVTWLIWAIYNLALHNGVDYFSPLLQTVIAQGSGGYLVHNVPLWFVTCLFVVEVLYYYICKLPDLFNVLICLGCAVLGYVMLNNNLTVDFTRLPWNIESALSAILFYCLGHLFVKHFGLKCFSEFVGKHKPIVLVLVAILTAILAFGAVRNGHVSIGSNKLGHNLAITYVIGLVGTASTLLFANWMECTEGISFVRGIEWIGRNSFYIMAVHVPIKGFLSVAVAKMLSTSSETVYTNYWMSAIVFVLTLLASSLIAYSINILKDKFTVKG